MPVDFRKQLHSVRKVESDMLLPGLEYTECDACGRTKSAVSLLQGV